MSAAGVKLLAGAGRVGGISATVDWGWMRLFLLVLIAVLAACSPQAGSEEVTTSDAAAPETTLTTTTTPATSEETSSPSTTVTETPASTTTSDETTTTTATTTSLAPTTEPVATAPPGLSVEVVAEAPGRVTAMANLPDGSLVLAMQSGEIGVLSGGEATIQTAIPVSAGGERGLLGLAIHPEEPERWFLSYTNESDGGTVLSEFAAPDGMIDTSTEQVIFTASQPASNHNGGMIQFGPDGMLYLGVGDGGGGGDQFGNGQDTDTPLGGILRFDVDSDDPIPSDNPGFGASELWVYGLRNPWRFDWAGERLFIADVGQSAYEEISVLTRDDSGANLGWPVMEGNHCYQTPDCDPVGVLPVHEVEHGDNGTCSITGGVVYQGEAIPELTGHYLFSDFCGGYLRSIRVDDEGNAQSFSWIEDSLGSVVTFGEDPDSEALISIGGRLLRIVPTGR